MAQAVREALARGDTTLHERFDQVLLETALDHTEGHRQLAAEKLGLGGEYGDAEVGGGAGAEGVLSVYLLATLEAGPGYGPSTSASRPLFSPIDSARLSHGVLKPKGKSMDRSLLKAHFLEKEPPDWVCPQCRKSLLRIKPGTFSKSETFISRGAHDHEAWEPEWVRYVYSCLLECSNESCKEVVASGGVGSVSYDVKFDRNGEPDYEFADFFQPKFFDPPLRLIKVPSNCPQSIEADLERSFTSFFSSPEAALNSARAAVEVLLTELGIKRFNVVGGKRRPINLHTRITLVPSPLSHVKDLLTAIKWLGNAGSHHGSVVAVDDVIDAYELIEHVLEEVYGGKAKAMKALAKKVNKRKGPKK